MTHPEDTPGAEPIAIVGVAARVPGAPDTAAFWRNLVDGVESVTRFTREEQLARGAKPAEVDDPGWVSAAPMVTGFDEFDAGLFGMSELEARVASPNHRLFMESCFTALQDAGYDPARYDGPIGVYAGTGGNDYLWENVLRNAAVGASPYNLVSLATGNSPNYVATLPAYKLDLRGPSLTVHTACSTSLVAFHLACEALRNHECDMALAGGVNIEFPQGVGYLGMDGFTSPDAHCRPFDAGANGTVWGSGVGVALIKRLSDAVADGDTIRAVVLGNAINNDGAGKVGFTAPSQDGQAEAIAQAVAMAGVDPRTVTYIEAHGTGTAVGDPIEVAALSSVYGQDTADRGWCGIGSVKSNIGHLSQAAGIISLIKVVLAMEHGLIPPTINYERPNPAIDFAATPFWVADSLTRWEPDGVPRRAGVSSFGIGGTNAHVLLEQAPAPRPAPRAAGPQVIQVSARSAAALDKAVADLADHLANTDVALPDVAMTLREGRAAHAHRAAVVAEDTADAVAALKAKRRRITGVAGEPRVAFLFSGQGSQYAGMAAALYEREPVFAAAVDECVAVLGEDLRALLLDPGTGELIGQTRHTQPALFTVEYALARLWESVGVRPAAMLGHSIGEYAAATVAGVFTLPDALRVVAERGRLMQSLPPGAMLAVQLDEADVELPEGLSVATVNGPGTCVVAGETAAVEAYAADLADRGVKAKALRTSHAFHSAMMDPILPAFTEFMRSVPLAAPAIPVLSNVTGGWLTDEQATDPAYWAAHLRQPVRFGAAVATLLAADGPWQLLEVGPGRQLAGLARMQVARADEAQRGLAPLTSLPGQGEPEVFATAAATLWTLGLPVRLPSAPDAGRVPLPVYPFERKRYWVDPDPEETVAKPRGPRPLDDWFAVPVWRQAVATAPRGQLGRVLLLGDGPRADALAEGMAALRVRAGDAFARTDDGFTVRPGERADYEAMVDALGADLPEHIVHAFALDGDPAGEDPAAVWAAQERGFHSALGLAQALAGRSARLDIVCSGIGDVRGDDLTRPEHATLLGIARVLPAELPDLELRLIDADSDAALLDELRRPVTDREVTLRGNRRWVLGFDDVRLTEAEDGIRDGGRYLITGGLGGIGITLAEDLAVRAKARLVLTARVGLPPRAEWDTHLAVHGDGPTSRIGRAIAAIRRMEAAGAEVLVLAADVTDVDSLRRVRAAAVEAFGGLDGVVHAAGVAGGGVAEVKERAAAERVLAPKLTGTLALASVFGGDELDFVVLCSSVTSVLGGFGQVDYCAANAFLDAHARAGRGWRAPLLSQNWGGWAELGMAVETAALAQSGQVTVDSAIDHPVLTTLSVTGDEAVAHGIVTPATHWLLDEHRIGGTAVVPGTAHLECARAAFAAAVPGAGSVELRDVVFLEPFAVPDGDAARYEVVLTVSGTTAEFVVQGRRGGVVTRHVQGAAEWGESAGEKLDVSAVAARTEPLDATTGFGTGRTSMLSFGPRWASLREHRAAADEELATIVAPPAAEGDDWVLHPALLDVATAFGAGRGSGAYLPMSYGRVVVRDRLPERFHSHLRYRPSDGDELVVADLSLVDDDGRELVAVSEFLLRRVDQDAVTSELGSAPAPARRRDPASGDIAPADGVAAFRRSLAAGLGAQVVITPVSVAEIAARAHTPADTAAEATVVVEGDASAGPRTELEAVIVRAWQDSLGVGAIGVHDDFFALGGNSLVAVQLIAALRSATGVRLPMRSLFEVPTVAGLAERIEELRAEAEPEPEPTQTIRRLPRA
ncbi:type I polyketide synthase [Actinokineospora sp. UTMC 2448]|uniref:type I polyketide synthase n=1 Tax=Actinokineospora sp. UTMC 2448 TaxID=2268449 RepID=UPI00216464A0|nr:type I polyketide synthase [Actinokineospora sp. UTMC 2448]UVS77137.1 Beta-ketoacyl-acyl-carrier-protein synthase I [Actinokineospora sp. UTMC 2448]